MVVTSGLAAMDTTRVACSIQSVHGDLRAGGASNRGGLTKVGSWTSWNRCDDVFSSDEVFGRVHHERSKMPQS